MTRFFWVRHGPTHAKAMIGWTDLPADLSDTDHIARIDRALPARAVVVSSDLQRAVQTADHIAGARPRLPHHPQLREISFGAWEGLSYAEVAAKDPDHIRAFWETPGDIAPPNGESWNGLCRRVWAATDELHRAYQGQNIIIVAHFGVIVAALQRAMGISITQAFAHKIDPLSVSEIAYDGNRWQVGAINHLF